MQPIPSLLGFILGLSLLICNSLASRWQPNNALQRIRRDNDKRQEATALANATHEPSASSHSVSHQVPVLKLSAVFAIGDSNVQNGRKARRESSGESQVEIRSSQSGTGWDDIKGSASSKSSSYGRRKQRKRDDTTDSGNDGHNEQKHEIQQHAPNEHLDETDDVEEQKKAAPATPIKKKQVKKPKASPVKADQPSKSRLKVEVSTKTMIKEKVNLNAENEPVWPSKKHCNENDGDGRADARGPNEDGLDRSFDNHGGSGSSLTDFFEEFEGTKSSRQQNEEAGDHEERTGGEEAHEEHHVEKKKHHKKQEHDHKKEKKHQKQKKTKKVEQQVEHEQVDDHKQDHEQAHDHEKEEKPHEVEEHQHEEQPQQKDQQPPAEKKQKKKHAKKEQKAEVTKVEAPKVEPVVAAVVEKPKEEHKETQPVTNDKKLHHEPKHGHLELHQHQHVEHHHHLNLHQVPVPEPEPIPEHHELPMHEHEHSHEPAMDYPSQPQDEHHLHNFEDTANHGHHFANPMQRGFEHHQIPIKEHWIVPDLIEKTKSKEHPFGAFVIEDHSEMENRDSHPDLRYTEDMVSHPHGKGLSPVGIRQLMAASSARSNSKVAKTTSVTTPATSNQIKPQTEASRN